MPSASLTWNIWLDHDLFPVHAPLSIDLHTARLGIMSNIRPSLQKNKEAQTEVLPVLVLVKHPCLAPATFPTCSPSTEEGGWETAGCGYFFKFE